MKQKLALSCALIHKPKLLILDEPTTGVDAVSRSEFWTMLAKLRQHNITIIVSTPYMDEAMRCDRVALIQNGFCTGNCNTTKDQGRFQQKAVYDKGHEKYKLITALRKYPETVTAYPFGDSVHVTFSDDRINESLFKFLDKAGINNVSAEETIAGIEDRFLELMEERPKGGRAVRAT